MSKFLAKTVAKFAACLAAAASLSVPAQAAQVDPAELSRLAAQAQKNGAAAVMVHLVPTTMDQLGNNLSGVKADVARRKALLLAELGPRPGTVAISRAECSAK